MSPPLQADSLPAEPQGKPKNTGMGSLSILQWKWQPTPVFCLGNPTDRGAWQATVHTVAKSQTRVSDLNNR